MTKEDKVIFLKNPNEVLEHLIKNFVKTSELNRRTQIDHGIYFDEPLVGFASGNDPLFFEYKNIIGSFHSTPREIIAAALREKAKVSFLPKRTGSASSHGFFPPMRTYEKATGGRNDYLRSYGSISRNLGKPVTLPYDSMSSGIWRI